jgi:PKHD-type hydroxylase
MSRSRRVARELGQLIVAELERSALFISAVLPYRVYPPVFNRYGEGMEFGMHVDGAVRTIPGSGQKLRTDLSATVFLSAPDSYEGGELVIERDLGRETGRCVGVQLGVAASGEPVVGAARGPLSWVAEALDGDLRRARFGT